MLAKNVVVFGRGDASGTVPQSIVIPIEMKLGVKVEHLEYLV